MASVTRQRLGIRLSEREHVAVAAAVVVVDAGSSVT